MISHIFMRTGMTCIWIRLISVSLLAFAVLELLSPAAPPVSAAAIVSPDGWEWQDPLPPGHHLYRIWGNSSSDVFVVGDSGAIFHHNGSSWTSMTSGATHSLNGVWGSSSSNVF